MSSKRDKTDLATPPGGPRRRELVRLVRQDEAVLGDAGGEVSIVKKEPKTPIQKGARPAKKRPPK